MRDLVESVIDGILQHEKMQQHATNQKKHRAAMQSHPTRTEIMNQARLHNVGPQVVANQKERDPALWKVSRQFEAIFVQQMMSEMRKSVDKSDFMPGGFAEDVHGSMMDEAIAQASVKQHSFGIADNIYRQMEAAQRRSKQSRSIQEISASADTLKMHHNVTLEVNGHAH